MRCEACNVKFSFFKRKRTCMDCLRYFCSECVIKRQDQSVSCDSCSILSRRPVVRCQIAQIRLRDLRHYLAAKRICVKGCIEKDDLIRLVVAFGNANHANSHRSDSQEYHRFSYTNFESNTDASSEPSRFNDLGSSSPSAEADSSASTRGSSTVESSLAENSSRFGAAEMRVEQPRDIEEESRLPKKPSGNNVEMESEPETLNATSSVEIEEICGNESSCPSSDSGPEPQVEEAEEAEEAEEEGLRVPADSTTTPGSSLEESETSTRVHEQVPPMQWKTGLVKLDDINENWQVRSLSVKQLKHLLASNGVDYKGCIERSELIHKASRLWEEYKQSREDVEKLEEADLCKICWDAPIECVILECGHMAFCINCGKQMSECPICKQYIVRVVRFWKA